MAGCSGEVWSEWSEGKRRRGGSRTQRGEERETQHDRERREGPSTAPR